MQEWQRWCWCLGVLVGAACGGGHDDAGGAAPVDAGGPEVSEPEAGASDRPDGGEPGDGGPEDPRPVEDDESFVPAGLDPTDAARLVVMGDSISTGTGARNAAHAYFGLLAENDDAEWPDAAASDLASLFGHEVPVVDVARSGATSRSMLSEDQRVDLEQALGGLPVTGHTIVVVTIGGNDLSRVLLSADPTGRPLDAVVDNLRALVDWLQDPTRFPDGVSIYLMDVYDPSDGTGHIDGCFFNVTVRGLTETIEAWRDAYVALGQELGFAVVDALGRFRGHGFSHDDPTNAYYDAGDPSGWFADCLHPNDRGHHEIRLLFFGAIDADDAR